MENKTLIERPFDDCDYKTGENPEGIKFDYCIQCYREVICAKRKLHTDEQ